MTKKVKSAADAFLEDRIRDYLAATKLDEPKLDRLIKEKALFERAGHPERVEASAFLRLYANSVLHLDDLVRTHFEEEMEKKFPDVRVQVMQAFPLDVHGEERAHVSAKRHGAIVLDEEEA